MRFVLVCLVLLVPSAAFASNALTVLSAQLDRPTITALGVQLLIADDDNFDATVSLRYRAAGTSVWRDGPELHRVHPELVVGRTVPAQFAGSVFFLAPDTAYELELHAQDPDGPVDQTVQLSGHTRPVPGDPTAPHAVNVTNASELSTALSNAQPGDVITLAAGTYAGAFSLSASGTPDNPIVVRGVDRDAVVLDGQGCAGCNVFEVYGSDVHLERMTLQNANRALRFQTQGATGNVVRRLRITNVIQGIAGKPDQTDFYVCDNVLEGRLSWPLTYADDGAVHASDEGIVVSGSGHVVCHNQVQGFGDALNSDQPGARADDFYGNDVRFTYDDGLELDESEGNVRAFRNRFTNTYDTLSFQPLFGGPAYAFQNVVVNVANEPFKLHALGTAPAEPPVGVLILNNTVVRAGHAIQLSTANALHDYVVENNVFLGSPTDGKVVEWDTPIDFATGTIDWNGYAPDGSFEFGYGGTGHTYASFDAVQAGGRYEQHGTLLAGPLFASGLGPPTDYSAELPPQDVALADGSPALDRARSVVGINDAFIGSAPDLGALERGCAEPVYGVRPEGLDETNEAQGCVPIGAGSSSGSTGGSSSGSGGGGTGSTGTGSASGSSASGGSGAAAGGTTGGESTPSGCGCGAGGAPAAVWGLAALLALGSIRPRRRR